ncbi:MAG: glycosyltransferase family 4 protein [Betaproteobacteria bacterium]
MGPAPATSETHPRVGPIWKPNTIITSGYSCTKPGLVTATVARPNGVTGIHTHMRTLHDGIIKAGYPCTIISPFSGSKKWMPVFAIRRLLLRPINRDWSTRWYRHWHFIALRENLRRYLAHYPVTTVIAQCTLSARAALDVRTDLDLGYRVVMTCHFNGSEAHEFREKGELNDEATYRNIIASEDEVLRTVDQTIHVSYWSKRSVESHRAIRLRNATVIWNGIAAAPPVSAITRADLGLANDDLALINVGTVEPRKNQIGLIDLFAAIYTRFPKARLLLVGNGPQYSEVQRKVERFGLYGRVKLLGVRRDVSALLALADLYIHYATLENCPVAMLEAARAGLPSAAVPVGGIPELQTQLESSVAIPANNIEVSLQTLEQLLSNPTLRAEWSRRAQHNFQKFFTCEAMVGAFLKALNLRNYPRTALKFPA